MEEIKKMDGDSKEQYSPRPRHAICTIPNLISLLRIASIPLIAWLVARQHLIAALIVLALSSASDGLDGYIARRFNQVSVLGQILDPIADRLLIICSVFSFVIAGIVPWWLVLVICLRDLILGIQVLILSNHGYGPLPVHFLGKVGTAVLLISIPVLIIADTSHGQLFFWLLRCVGLALMWWGMGLYWLSAFVYLKQGYQLLHPRSSRVGKSSVIKQTSNNVVKHD